MIPYINKVSRARGLGLGFGLGLGLGRRFGDGYNTNSPTMAYITAYGKEPEMFIRGKSFAPKKEWNGILVDAGLKEKWLNALNSIPYIEIRSTEEGKSAVRVAHVAFRMRDKKHDKYVKKIVSTLNRMPKIKASTDIGAQGRPRVMVAYPIWKGKKGWNEWWESIPGKIRKAVLASIKESKNA